MNAKEIIENINSGKVAIFEMPTDEKSDSEYKRTLVLIYKADPKDQFYCVETRFFYKNGEVFDTRDRKMQYYRIKGFIIAFTLDSHYQKGKFYLKERSSNDKPCHLLVNSYDKLTE